MKQTAKQAFLSSILVCSTANAGVTPGDIWGYAKTFYNNVTAFVGTTKVTPAYTLLDWREDLSGYYSNVYMAARWRFSRSMIVGSTFYDYKRLEMNGTWTQSNDPFQINVTQRLDYYCNTSTVDLNGNPLLFITNDTRDFHIAVWAGSIVKTGSFPPSQPYPVQLKSTATAVPSNCDAQAVGSQDTRRGVAIYDTGYIVTSMAMVNYDYNWPMLCWAGATYDY